MLDTIPNEEEMTALVGKSLYNVWKKLCAFIDEQYDMDCLWNKGGKAWKYEYNGKSFDYDINTMQRVNSSDSFPPFVSIEK